MKEKILFTLAYDGTNFSGWQKQKNDCVRTVQGEFEKACCALFHKPVSSIGASRTDSGVHALGQRATIDIDTNILIERLPSALNCYLPNDIAVQEAVRVPETFHCRFDVDRKTYEYKIYNNRYRNPIFMKYSELVYLPLDIIKMQQACQYFLGEHDFKAFCAANSQAKTTIRTIYEMNVYKEKDLIILRVTGNAFLYNMVRILAGTIISVGLGKIQLVQVPEILEGLDRTRAGKTASACGLVLKNIVYKPLTDS